jgi:hypothetical protein
VYSPIVCTDDVRGPSDGCGGERRAAHSASTPTTPLDAVGYICTGTGCNVQLLCTSIRALRYVPRRPLCTVHCEATAAASTPTAPLS